MAGGAARAGTSTTDRIESARSNDGRGSNAYAVDKLLRTGAPGSDKDNGSGRGELELIFANALREGGLPPADKSYLVHVVAARTGASERDAQERVDDAFAQEQQAAESARRGVAHSMYWTFLALLIGAFSASVAATIGGKERDRVVVIG
jgi:hypothetical protein